MGSPTAASALASEAPFSEKDFTPAHFTEEDFAPAKFTEKDFAPDSSTAPPFYPEEEIPPRTWPPENPAPLKLSPYQQAKMEPSPGAPMGAMGPEESTFTAELGSAAARGLGKAGELAGNAWTKLSTPLGRVPGVETIKQVLFSPFQLASDISEGNEGGVGPGIAERLLALQPPEKALDITAGAAAGAGEALNFFTSPLGVATLGTGILPKAAQRVVAGAFATQMASSLPQLWSQLKAQLDLPEDQRDYKEISRLTTGGAATLGFSAASGFHAVRGLPLGAQVSEPFAGERSAPEAPVSREAPTPPVSRNAPAAGPAMVMPAVAQTAPTPAAERPVPTGAELPNLPSGARPGTPELPPPRTTIQTDSSPSEPHAKDARDARDAPGGEPLPLRGATPPSGGQPSDQLVTPHAKDTPGGGRPGLVKVIDAFQAALDELRAGVPEAKKPGETVNLPAPAAPAAPGGEPAAPFSEKDFQPGGNAVEAAATSAEKSADRQAAPMSISSPSDEAAKRDMGAAQPLVLPSAGRADKSKTAGRLNALADNLQKQIDEKRNPAISQQNLTARRARIAEGMGRDADRIEKAQQALRAIAAGHESDDLPAALSKVTTKAQVDELLRTRYPQPYINGAALNSLLTDLSGKPGITALRSKLRGVVGREGGRLYGDEVGAVGELVKLAEQHGKSTRSLNYEIAGARRLATAGIPDEATWNQARSWLLENIAGPSEAVKNARARRELENSLIGSKIPGFFPTPHQIVARMIKAAEIKPGMRVLEPSAGKGDIADTIRGLGANLDLVEQNHTLAEILRAKGYNPTEEDFLKAPLGQYDRVVMNPPFENGQDVAHIQRAFNLLKPGGRLVAISSESPFFRDTEKAERFRALVERFGSSEKLESAFTGKEAFRQTGVSSRMVVLDKEEGRPGPASMAAGQTTAPAGNQPMVERTLRNLARQFPNAPKVTVLEHPEDFPEAVKADAAAQGVNLEGTRAAWHDNQIYMAARNLPTPHLAARTFLHEAVGHAGVEKVLGKNSDAFLNGVYKRYARSRLMDDIRTRYPGADELTLGAEVVAHLAERPRLDPGLWKTVVAKVRQALRAMGIKMEVSEGDVQEILRRALKRQGGTGADARNAAASFSAGDFSLEPPADESNGKERIYRAAVRMPSGRVYEGAWHGEALAKAEEAANAGHEGWDEGKMSSGFTTTDGRFLSKGEVRRFFPDEPNPSFENLEGKPLDRTAFAAGEAGNESGDRRPAWATRDIVGNAADVARAAMERGRTEDDALLQAAAWIHHHFNTQDFDWAQARSLVREVLHPQADWEKAMTARDEASKKATDLSAQFAAHGGSRDAPAELKDAYNKALFEARELARKLRGMPGYVEHLLNGLKTESDPLEIERLRGELAMIEPTLLNRTYAAMQERGDIPKSKPLPEPYNSLQKLTEWLRNQKIDSPRRTMAERLDLAQKAADIRDELKLKGSRAWLRTVATAHAMAEQFKHPPVDDDPRKLVKGYNLSLEQSNLETAQWMAEVRRKVDNPLRRQAIMAWIHAGGDEELLRDQAASVPEKFKPIWDTAQKLTEDEKSVANQVRGAWAQSLEDAKNAGLLEEGRENYAPIQWARPPKLEVPEQEGGRRGTPNIPSAKLDTRDPFFSFHRETPTLFDGLVAGGIPDAKTMDVASALGFYNMAFNQALRSRAFVKAGLDAQVKDGHPMVILSGRADAMEGQGGVSSKGYVVDSRYRGKEAVTQDGRPYLPFDHPALKDWKFVLRTDEGKPILARADMLIHPDVLKYFKAMLGTSPIREYALGRGLLSTSRFLKESVVAASPFHAATLAEHAASHTVNPFGGERLDLTQPKQAGLVRGGLGLGFADSQMDFMEGMGTHEGAFGWIPGLGQMANAVSHAIFKQYLPWLKMNTALHILERNLARYGGEGKGKLTEDQIYDLSASQANAAFGLQNYRLLGRSPFVRDLLSLGAFAPDFLISRAKFVGQALKPYGAEQRRALLVQAAGLYVVCRAIQTLVDPDHDPHLGWRDAFSVVYQGRRYSIRTVIGDVWHLATDPRSFAYGRISQPVRIGTEALTGKDWRGMNRTGLEQVDDALRGIAPMWLQGMLPGAKGREDTLLSAAGKAFGLGSRKDTAGMRVSELAKSFNRNSPDPAARSWQKQKDQETLPESDFGKLTAALEDNNLRAAERELEKLLASGHTSAAIFKHYRNERPFTGTKERENDFCDSLTPKQQEVYERARQERSAVADRFNEVWDRLTDKEPVETP